VESMARRSLVVFTSTVLVLLLTGFGVFGKYTLYLLASFGPLIASLTAAGICWRTARQTMGTERAWRLGMATGMGGWFAATAFWTIYQNIFHTQLSSPSLADIGFFSLPISALFALACFAREPRSERRHVRVVLLLDCVAVIGSLLVVIWLTDAGEMFSANAGWNLAHGLAIAHLALNFVLVVFVLMLWLARRVSESLRVQLALLGLGLLILAVSNFLYMYPGATGSHETDFSRFGYIVGPVVIMMAASTTASSATTSATTAVFLRRALMSLPYCVVAVAVAAVAFGFVIRKELDPMALTLGWSISIVVLARQVFILREDRAKLDELASAQAGLVYLAEHDPLTGVANRSYFDRYLAQALQANKHQPEALAIFFIDIDDFKSINDRYGHVAGDTVLTLLAKRLERCVRSDDIVARVGGDEFALLLRAGAWPKSVARRILDAVRQPYSLHGEWVVATVSIGLVELRGDEVDLSADELLAYVDSAMYRAKQSYGAALVSYDISELTIRPRSGQELNADMAAKSSKPA
jgi:diguanylate cyclase